MKRDVMLRALACSLLASSMMFGQATTQTTELKTPLNFTAFIPCAGESVQLSGELHTVSHVTFDANGGFHLEQMSQPINVSGLSASGVRYQGTGVTRSSVNIDGPPPLEQTMINNFRIIGQGPGNNYLVHVTLHMTVNANGTVTSNVTNASIDCK